MRKQRCRTGRAAIIAIGKQYIDSFRLAKEVCLFDATRRGERLVGVEHKTQNQPTNQQTNTQIHKYTNTHTHHHKTGRIKTQYIANASKTHVSARQECCQHDMRYFIIVAFNGELMAVSSTYNHSIPPNILTAAFAKQT